MSRSGLAVQRESAILAPVDTGRLRASIEITHSKKVIPDFVKVGPTVNYGAVVEFGRKAGARMPPPSALIPWIRRHGGSGNPEAAAFLLARAIAKRGIQPRSYMQKGYISAQRAINRIWDRVGRSIEMRWGRENG
jgi:phage gpG-like protein